MIKTPDESLDRFKELLKKEWSKLSESDTRSKIIDPLFKECLNWDEDDITREEHTESGYIDYLFKKGEKILFLVEAKKEGLGFEIPPNFKNLIYKINATPSQCKNLKEAIEQARQYCDDKGIRIAVVTNGHQFVIFEAITPGTPWREGKCIIFQSFEEIESRFNLFFKYLNKNSVISGSLQNLLSEKTPYLKFSRPIDKIINKDAPSGRNYLYNYISPFVKFIFGDITEPSKADILDKCYVYDKATYRDTDKGIKDLFIDRMPHFSKEDNIKFFEEGEKSAGWFEQCVDHVRKSTKKGELILLIGGIGSGKTTFIHRFYNVILKDELKNIWLYVDFKTAPTTIEKLEDYIYEKLINNFEDRYYDEVKQELDKFGIVLDKSNKEKYLLNLFAILRCMSYSVSVVLDNVDRCPDINLQEQIFASAQYIIDKFSILTLLTLREESYYRSKFTGVFDAYHLTRFFIYSPHFEKLILNRIDYMLDLLEKDDESISKIMDRKIDFEDKKEDVRIFFNVLGHSIMRDNADFMKIITLFITEISEGNMREALDMFNYFLSSENTKVREMVDKVNSGEGYIIAPYQFLKSVILSEAKYYRGDKSKIMNLFDLNTELTNSHFLHLRVLEYAFLNRANEARIERGFLEINKLVQEAEDLFIPQSAIEDSLLKLNKYGLIKFENYGIGDLKKVKYFKITGRGSYYLTQLIKQFIYIDLVQSDTQISDPNVADFLKRKIDSDFLEDKFARSEKFLQYLLEMEDKEFADNPNYENSILTNRRFIRWIIHDFIIKKDRILNKPKNKFMLNTNRNSNI